MGIAREILKVLLILACLDSRIYEDNHVIIEENQTCHIWLGVSFGIPA